MVAINIKIPIIETKTKKLFTGYIKKKKSQRVILEKEKNLLMIA